MSIPKKKLGNSLLNKSGRALQQENNNINAKIPTQKDISWSRKHLGNLHLGSVWRKRRFLSITPLIERYPLSLSFSLCASPKKFRFSANFMKTQGYLINLLTAAYPKSQKGRHQRIKHTPKVLLKAQKSIKNQFFQMKSNCGIFTVK